MGRPTPTPTPTVGEGKVVVTVINFGLRLNVRAGPGTNYEIVAKAAGGVVFNAIGRNEEGNWIQVSVADLPSGYGWVSTDYVTVEGQLEQLPVVEEMESTEEGVSPPSPVFFFAFSFSFAQAFDHDHGVIVHGRNAYLDPPIL